MPRRGTACRALLPQANTIISGDKMMTINNQKGFSLVQAIFILVVLALLGTYMVRLSTVGQATSTQTLLQARAYQAARAGLEWGISLVVKDNDHSAAVTACDSIGLSTSDGTEVVVDSFSGMVKVTCDPLEPYNEGAGDVGVYNLKAVATFLDISSPDYVSRKLEVTIHD